MVSFIADVMLGRLARYLRMAGNDVLYSNNADDDTILKIAKKEDRIILTRDVLMLERKDCKKKVIKSIFIKKDGLIGQLRQVKDELGLILKIDPVRCIECNSLLLKIKKGEVKDKVPQYVFKTQKNFIYCSRCRKYYWKGTHLENMDLIFKKVNNVDINK